MPRGSHSFKFQLKIVYRRPDSSGAIVLLPYLNFWSDDFSEEIVVEKENEQAGDQDDDNEENEEIDIRWTEKGIQFGKRLKHSILELDKALKQASDVTPVPTWALNEAFTLPKEKPLRSELLKTETQIENLLERKQRLTHALAEEGLLRRLLYEQGKLLEKSIIAALQLLGFRAATYQDAESEFDVVFESEEGRMLGEAEGKDNSAVNIDKMRQLEMNIHEDFAREDVKEMAKGVLFGNAFRLKEIEKRSDFFTLKCMIAAKRAGAALVRTPDLFTVAQYLSGSKDDEFARNCRQALFGTSGEIVVFPSILENQKNKRDHIESTEK